VDHADPETIAFELLRQPVRAVFGAREDQRLPQSPLRIR